MENFDWNVDRRVSGPDGRAGFQQLRIFPSERVGRVRPFVIVVRFRVYAPDRMVERSAAQPDAVSASALSPRNAASGLTMTAIGMLSRYARKRPFATNRAWKSDCIR